MFMGFPGLKIALPSTPADAKGLMAASIRDDNPVCYLINYLQVLEHGDVPEGEYVVPFGEAAIRREGSDVTIVATGWTVGRALDAAETLAEEGINAEVIDPRTLNPLDTATILSSVEKTGRLVIADQGTRHGGASAVIAAEVAEHGFGSLKAPIAQVTALDVTVPYCRADGGVRPAQRGEDRGLRAQHDGGPPTRSARSGIAPRKMDTDVAQALLRTMWRIRCFEERVAQLKRTLLVHGLIHLSIGGEGVAAAVCGQLRDDDAVYSGHRAHGHAIAKGAPIDRMMAELMGRVDGLCQGIGGSMHLVDTEHGFMGATGVVGGNLPLALGTALAQHLAGGDRVSVVFFGDGAVQAGHFNETINLAALWQLPVIFVCENNGFAEFTSREEHSTIERVSDVVAPYGFERETVERVRRSGGLRRVRAVSHRGADRKGPVPARVPDLPPARPLRGRPAEVPRRRGRGGVARARPDRAVDGSFDWG